jgi:hypothetical protein
MLAGDFNLFRNLEDRNRPGGDSSEMQMFNNAIIDLDLIKVPFSGRRFTWSNMQLNPLLMKLDWVFVSSSWGLSFPTTSVQPLSKPISDHIPYVINIGSKVPKSKFFRFENFWLDQPDFLQTVELHWNSNPYYANAARTLCAKFKQTRAGLKSWSKKLSNLSRLIHNCSWVLQLLDGLEDQRSLSNLESAFRKLVKSHLSNLLEAKRKYWKQRNTIRWITLGDENTSFFQAMPTHRHSKKYIGSLAVHDDIPITDHEQKARILWNAFKDRLGINYFQGISYDLEDLLQSHDLSSLVRFHQAFQ